MSSTAAYNTSLPITVVISTRDRSGMITQTISSILANDHQNFQLFVIDQNLHDETYLAVKPFLSDSRVIYHRSSTVGVSNGRNLGISLAKSDLIAITDDDCIVERDWLRNMVTAFQYDSRIGVVFGYVDEGEHDTTKGFIPAYQFEQPALIRTIPQKLKRRGMSACMGLRRSVWEMVKGFDPMLGAGAPFRAAPEYDFMLKVITAGFYVVETPEIKVIHYGFRTWQQGKALAARNWFGIGAGLIKFVKLGHWSVLLIIGYEWGGIAMSHVLYKLIRERRLAEMTPVIAMAQGMWSGLLTPIEPGTNNYHYQQQHLPFKKLAKIRAG